MRLALAILGLSLAGTLNAAALDVRSASEVEITQALHGCWNQELTFGEIRQNERLANAPIPFIPLRSWACFEADGALISGWVGGHEGRDGLGSFEIAHGKLRLREEDSAGAWIFGADELECDVIMNPGRAMKLTNCVGLGENAGKAVADTSYEFDDD